MEMKAMKLHELQESRAATVAAMRAINDLAEKEERDYSKDEDKRHQELKVELAGLDKKIERARDLAEAERSAPAILHHGRGDGNFEERCRSFSLRAAIASQIPGLNVDAGRELEISRELERRNGRSSEGVLCPMSVFEKRVVTTGLPAGGPGSNIIGIDFRPDQFIDILRVQMKVQALGARVLSGLVGNVAIPRLKASATGYWVAENSAITASDQQFDQVTLSPKHVGALTEVSRNMILQSTPDIEQILRDDFAALLARALDAVAIQGGGANQPTGILATSGVTDVPGGANGLAPTWANIIALVTAVGNANALTGSLGFLTNSPVLGKLANTLRSTADTSSNFIVSDPGATELAGYPLAISNNVPSNLTKGTSTGVCSAIIFGNWSDLLIGYWSAFDLLVNPFESTAYPKGNVQTRGMLTADIAVRQPKAFAKTADVLTT
jgi:HK97 family phage major capsid protein